MPIPRGIEKNTDNKLPQAQPRQVRTEPPTATPVLAPRVRFKQDESAPVPSVGLSPHRVPLYVKLIA